MTIILAIALAALTLFDLTVALVVAVAIRRFLRVSKSISKAADAIGQAVRLHERGNE